MTVEQPVVIEFKKPDTVAGSELAAASFKKGTPDCAIQARLMFGKYGRKLDSHVGYDRAEM